MGKTAQSLIQVKDDLTAKPGDTITFATVRRLVGAGVTGNTILEGNEEILDQRSMRLTVYPIRHAVAVSAWDEQKSSIALRDAARDALMNWAMEKLRADIIMALSSISVNAGTSVSYAAATAAQRNTWMVSNADRVRFGNSAANASSGVMATALAAISPTTDRITGALLSLMKRNAQTATPHIRPIQMDDDNDEEWFVVFMPSRVYRDFRNDPAVNSANTNARPRENGWEANPLFSGGDLVWDGMFVRELPELPVLTGVGSGGSDVAAVFICGAQALGCAWAQRTKSTTNERDYKFMHGVGIQEMRGIGKLCFGKDAALDTTTLADQGIATLFVSAPPDA